MFAVAVGQQTNDTFVDALMYICEEKEMTNLVFLTAWMLTLTVHLFCLFAISRHVN